MKFKAPLFILSYVVVALLGALIGKHFFKVSFQQTETNNPEYSQAITHSGNPLFKNGEKVLIAHAGGGFGEYTCTNSLEAMNQSAAQGTKFIELDFMDVENGDIILLHDWFETYDSYFRSSSDALLKGPVSRDERPKTAAEFTILQMKGGLTPMSMRDLFKWMDVHTGVFIVTDVKGVNFETMRHLRDMAQSDTSRFIVQIYHPDQYTQIRALGFENIILTVYRMGEPLDISVEDLGDFCRENQLFALTMPDSWFAEDTFARLGETNTPLFLHTTNGYEVAKRYFAAGVSGLYTDYITPQWMEENRKHFK